MMSILTRDWPYSAAMTDAPSNWLSCLTNDQVFTYLPISTVDRKLAELAKLGYRFNTEPYAGGTLLTCKASPEDDKLPWRKK